jgi:IS4 transposase
MSGFHYFGTWRRIVNGKMLRMRARETGFRKRRRGKLDGARFFWASVLGGRIEAKRTMAGLARAASLYSGERVSRQAFHQRMTTEAVAFMGSAFHDLMAQSRALTGDPLPGILGEFKDVNAIDSTTLRLADRLARRYPACRSNVRQAALKLHTRMSLTDKEVEHLRFTAERVHDRKGLEIGAWVKDRLLLFDLGYADYRLCGGIREHGGDFLTRLKESANGTVLGVRRGCAKRHIGGLMNRLIYVDTIVDIDVEFGSGEAAIVLRVVGIWNPERKDFHWYVTTLSPEDFSPEEIAQIYRLRWQIELLFKMWKSLCRLNQLPSGKEEVVLCLVYAGLCAALLARIVSWLASRRYDIPWHQMCASTALQILTHYTLTLGRSILRGSLTRLREVVSDLLEILGAHARLPNGNNAVVAFADGRC